MTHRNTKIKQNDFILPEFHKQACEDVSKQITLKFLTQDDQVFTKNYPRTHTIGKIKSNFVDLFGIPFNSFILLYKEKVVQDNTALVTFESDRFGILELRLLTNSRSHQIHVENAYKDLTIPDILTVQVQTEHEGFKEIVVEIENQVIEKPYLGGYRHIKTGVQYLHGYSQTGPQKKKVLPEMKNHRDTQTYFMRNRRTEKEYSTATQMTNEKTWIPNINDKILTAGEYETADEREKRLDVDGKVRTIQRYCRAWKIRKCLKEMHEEYWKRMRLEMETDAREHLEDEERKRKDLIRKVYPMTSADFAMLYTMVERWKKSEIQRIARYHCGAAKITEFSLMLDKEIELLQSIERIRQKVRKDLEIKKTVDFFKAIGTPLEWNSSYKNIHIQMDTLETQKGREYFAMYQSISDKTLSRQDRIENFINLKAFINEHNCPDKTSLIRLIDRATEMLARGLDQRSLNMLQKRIEDLLLHHFKLPQCNEGVTEHITRTAMQEMEQNLIYCHRCQKLKTMAGFSLDARVDKIMVCSACKWLDKVQEPWMDLSPYKYILKQIRNYERLHHASSSVAFILQDRDIHHIVNNIWHGHSALSECTDIYQLRLCRWRKEKEWAPWNCILLTLEEAKVHLMIPRLEDVYEDEFFNHIFNKHALARQNYPQLQHLQQHFAEANKGDATLDEAFWARKPSQHCLHLE